MEQNNNMPNRLRDPAALKAGMDQLQGIVKSAETMSTSEITVKMEELALVVQDLNKDLKDLAKENKSMNQFREMIALAARSVPVVLHNKHLLT